jgi:alanyl-tRNA synthetase
MENMETVPQLNDHNKQEYPPMHTAEHILNATMVKMFGCPRSKNAHIERKKSKCDYILESEPTEAQIVELESKVNEVIASNLEVTIDFVTHQEAASIVDLSKLPDDVSETLRIVRVGDYDACACIGAHVLNTSEIGPFKILSHSFNDGIWRVRWRVCER